MNEILREKIKKLPENSGVYLMKDADKNIIYVGKAKVLKNRVSQYFRKNSNHPPKVAHMVTQIEDFEYIITSNEIEALVLESKLSVYQGNPIRKISESFKDKTTVAGKG